MKKKLIEVALPLEAINKASAREKSIRHGHPSTLHLWWARRPLAACRAVLFASLVDDPGDEKERQRLFKLIEDLVQWENVNNQTVLDQARAEILKSTGGNPPPIYDPFCGGGSIPLEAQRLGLEAHASDLNPVAVLITKALIEIPAKFANQPPTNPEAAKKFKASWPGASGLAEDVRYYAGRMRRQVVERIGHLYPSVRLNNGSEATVIAWIWARTVTCPNPACGTRMPLVRSFALGTKPGKKAWVEPIVEHKTKSIRFEIRTGGGTVPESTVNRRGAKCLACGTTVPLEYVRAEGRAQRMSAQMMAVAAEGVRGRIYLSPSLSQEELVADVSIPEGAPTTDLPEKALGFRVQAYGIAKHRDLYTPRQLMALTAVSDLVSTIGDAAMADGATKERADAIATYLAFFVSRLADLNNAFCQWRSDPAKEHVGHLFARQAVSMVWDFAEANPLGNSAGGWEKTFIFISKFLDSHMVQFKVRPGEARQLDATQLPDMQPLAVFSTDPPYYDNIGYADLSDFFYVWLRRCLSSVYPDLFSTVLVPKKQELIATPDRHGSKEEARAFFEEGFGKAVARMRANHDPNYPLTIFYAFKQAESGEDDDDGNAGAVASTGWETMLEGLLKAGFQIDGTWPSRSELGNRMRSFDSNALASSIVLVCRPRLESAPVTTRKDFLMALRRDLPTAVRTLQQGNIAPVDLQQAAIGPGMAVFSRYQKVLETDGTPMKVRTALALINQMLDEVLTEQENDFDPYTRFALFWFEQVQFEDGTFDDAEKVARAKAISVTGVAEAGIAFSKAGRVRLLKRSELSDIWDPTADGRLTVWEATQHLIRALDQGVDNAANLAGRLGGLAETARELAYRLYTICERKGWAEEAQAYNGLVVNWPDIRKHAEEFTLQ